MMDFICVLVGTNLLAFYLFKYEWLFSKKPFNIILFLNFLLLVVGYALQHYLIGNQKFVIALKMPFISQLLFISFVTIFRKVYKRDPKETFWSMDWNLIKDGLFNFVLWLACLILPAILVFKKII